MYEPPSATVARAFRKSRRKKAVEAAVTMTMTVMQMATKVVPWTGASFFMVAMMWGRERMNIEISTAAIVGQMEIEWM